MKKLIVMFSALVLATVGLTAAAQTGDGATPAEEGGDQARSPLGA